MNIEEYIKMAGELLSIEEEKLLIEKIQGGNQDALEELWKSNMRFLISLANQYKNEELPIENLIVIGQEAIKQTAMQYDVSSNERFIKFAVPFIREAMNNAT